MHAEMETVIRYYSLEFHKNKKKISKFKNSTNPSDDNAVSD